MTGAVDVHRALADPTRVAILDHLRESAGDVDVAALAADAGVHPNTVRSHLAVLERAGLAHARSESRLRPGRPRRLWTASPAPDEIEHALLAEALVEALEPLEEGAALAEQAGEAWGRRLVEGWPPQEEPLAGVTSALQARGFEPQTCAEGIAMRRCPFRELAEAHPRVVCGFHAGLITGALERLDTPWRLRRLQPWASHDRCVAHLDPSGR